MKAHQGEPPALLPGEAAVFQRGVRQREVMISPIAGTAGRWFSENEGGPPASWKERCSRKVVSPNEFPDSRDRRRGYQNARGGPPPSPVPLRRAMLSGGAAIS